MIPANRFGTELGNPMATSTGIKKVPHTHPVLFEYACHEARIPRAYLGLHLDDLSAAARTPVEKFLDTLRDRYVTSARPLSEYPKNRDRIGRGILFYGQGSNQAACTLQQELYRKHSILRSLYMPVSDLMDHWSAKMSLANSEDFDQQYTWSESVAVLEEVQEIPFLVLANLGTEHATDFSRTTVENLLRRRHDNARPSIITSGLTESKLRRLYQDLMPFLADTTDFIEL